MVIDSREITTLVNLCTENGRLNQEAIGWSRHPYHTCHIPGHWLRKKKWNFWLASSPSCVAILAIVHLDYVGAGFLHVIDLDTGEIKACLVKVPFGKGIALGHTPHDDASFFHKNLSLTFSQIGEDTMIEGKGSFTDGESFFVSLAISSPGETLNVVIPWSDKRFQFTSKQNCRATSGYIKCGEKTYRFDPGQAQASLDFGRGVWPYDTRWNWATCSGKSGEDVIGFNFGSGWTDGTGMTENGVVINGHLHKLNEQISFHYDPQHLMAPWKVETSESDRVKLIFTPEYRQSKQEDYRIVRTSLHQIIGRFNGSIVTEEGIRYRIKDQIGICEEQQARW